MEKALAILSPTLTLLIWGKKTPTAKETKAETNRTTSNLRRFCISKETND